MKAQYKVIVQSPVPQRQKNGLATLVIGLLMIMAADGVMAQMPTNIPYARRDLDQDGIPDDMTTYYQVQGRITSPDLVGAAPEGDFEMYIQDPAIQGGIQAGILVKFPRPESFDISPYQIGVEVQVAGYIGFTNGITFIQPAIPGLHFDVIDPTPLPITPKTVNLDTLLASPEQYEGTLVYVSNVDYSGAPYLPDLGSGAGLPITDTTTNIIMYVDSDTSIPGQPAPTNGFDLVGIFTQYDSFPPFVDGYQIIPRFYTDLIHSPPPTAPDIMLDPDGPISVGAGEPVEIRLLGRDANAEDALIISATGAPAGSTLVGDSYNDRLFTFSWTPDPSFSDSTNSIRFILTDGNFNSTAAVEVVVLPEELAAFVINEVLYDPASGGAGDANGDGTRHYADDEFVEIYNSGTGNVDISGWTLETDTSIKYTFQPGTILTGKTAVVVFGGGTPAGTFGGAQIFNAGTWNPGLSNSGSDGPLRLVSHLGLVIEQMDYAVLDTNPNQSVNRDPDMTGLALKLHSGFPAASGALFSPGTKVDGSSFDVSGQTNTPPSVDLVQDVVARLDETVTVLFAATDLNGDSLSFSFSNAPPSAVITDFGDGTAELVYTALIDDAGTNFPIDVLVSDGSATDAVSFTIYVPSAIYSGLIINEFLPDPSSSSNYLDTNLDGVENINDDEFVELVNNSGAAVELLGISLEDASFVRHTFGSLTLPDGGAVVIFGGGDLSSFTWSPAATATAGTLSLGNGGDTLRLKDPAGNLLDIVSYSDPGVPDGASLTRNPDISGDFESHLIPGGYASPGRRIDGSQFLANLPPILVLPSSAIAYVGETFNLLVTATDVDGDTIAITTHTVPPDSTFMDHGNGTADFSFTPDVSQVGIHTVSFIATDVDGSDTNGFGLVVLLPEENIWDFETGLQDWIPFSRTSNQDWERDTGTGAEDSTFFMTINGWTADTGCDDWLISPELNLSEFNAPAVTFWIQRTFAGSASNRQFLVSTNYPGSGDPAGFAWDTMLIEDPGNAQWPTQATVSVAGYTNAPMVRIAFRYESDGPGIPQHNWSVDQIRLVDLESDIRFIRIFVSEGIATLVFEPAGYESQDTSDDFQLWRSSVVEGGYVQDTEAVVSGPTGGPFTATAVVGEDMQFFRIVRP